MSNESKKNSRKRSYTLRARARRQEQVHRRITLAAVHLHQTVGPARTTMNAIAERAGVRRATVYNHFPTELELIDACSSHWFEENPPPDPGPWAGIADPALRTETALTDMYRYYDGGREMLGNVLRDTSQVAALDEIVRSKWLPLLDGIIDVLFEPWASSGNDGQNAEIRATLRVALDFFTWKMLTDSGLSNEAAARIATKWLAAGRMLDLN